MQVNLSLSARMMKIMKARAQTQLARISTLLLVWRAHTFALAFVNHIDYHCLLFPTTERFCLILNIPTTHKSQMFKTYKTPDTRTIYHSSTPHNDHAFMLSYITTSWYHKRHQPTTSTNLCNLLKHRIVPRVKAIQNWSYTAMYYFHVLLRTCWNLCWHNEIFWRNPFRWFADSSVQDSLPLTYSLTCAVPLLVFNW